MKGPRLTVAAVRCFVGFFLLTGLAALVVGVHDVSLPGGRLGVLFPGILLLFAGAVFLAAAWQLVPIARRQRSPEGEQTPVKEPVPLAFLLSILLGVYVFFGALAGTGTQRAIVTGVSLVFIAAGAFGLQLFWNEIEVRLLRVGAGIALGLAGLLVGGWEFWYQNQYVPSHLDRAVDVQVALKKLRTQGAYDVLSATFGYQDIGDRSVVVLGSDYTLTGSVVVTCLRSATPAREAGVFTGQIPDPQRRFTSDVWELQPATVLAAGRFISDGKRLGPNAPASRQMIFYVPHDRYQLLRLRAQAYAVSASAPLTDQPPLRRDLGDNDLYDLWQLAGSGWFENLLSGQQRWIVTRYELVVTPGKTTSAPDLRLTAHYASPTWSGKPPTKAQIRSLFHNEPPVKATESFADAELPIAPVTAPTPKELESTDIPKCESQPAATRRK